MFQAWWRFNPGLEGISCARERLPEDGGSLRSFQWSGRQDGVSRELGDVVNFLLTQFQRTRPLAARRLRDGFDQSGVLP